MGFFSDLFFGSDGSVKSGEAKVSTKGSSRSGRTSHDRYTSFNDNGRHSHVHDNYTYNRSSGTGREYSGGENSGDRSYNK